MHLFALALALTLASSPARRPPTPEETKAFEQGRKSFERGEFHAAADAFRAGYELGRDPAFLVPWAEACEKDNRPADAADAYRRYLREAPDAADRADIEARLARIIPPAPPEPAAASPDTPSPLPAASPPPPPAAQAADADARGERPPGAGEPPPVTALAITGWSTLGASAIALGVTAFFGAKGAEAESDMRRLIDYRDERSGAPAEYADVAAEYESARDRGTQANTRAKVCLGIAGALAAIGIVMVALDAAGGPSRDTARLDPPGTWRF